MPLSKQAKKDYDTKRRAALKAAGLCSRCKSINDTDGAYCAECNLYYKTKSIEKQTERLAAGLCRGCGTQPVPHKRDCQRCLDRQAVNQARRSSVVKTEVLTAYGGIRCVATKLDGTKCSETDIDVLTIDHISNNGAEQRRELGGIATGSKFYAWLKRHDFPSGYQVLCMSCNFKKHILNLRDK